MDFSCETILSAWRQGNRTVSVTNSSTCARARARARAVEVALTKPSDKRTRNFIPRTNYGPRRCTRLQAFIVEMSFRENCAATRARARTSRSPNSAPKNGLAPSEIRDRAAACLPLPLGELRARPADFFSPTLTLSLSPFFLLLEICSGITILLIGNFELGVFQARERERESGTVI